MIIAGIECDRCGEMLYWPHAPKRDIVEWARDRGYSVGKQCFCPNCRRGGHKQEKAKQDC